MNSISLKVVTGIRRCGKSVLLEQYQDRLRAAGVEAEQIRRPAGLQGAVPIYKLPLSFREYVTVTDMQREDAFAEYMKTGGIPQKSDRHYKCSTPRRDLNSPIKSKVGKCL